MEKTVFVLHTNDIHSHFEELARIAGQIREVRRRVGAERLIVLDSGDFLDRARLETEGTGGVVNRALIEAIGYDAVLFGNNEGLSYTRAQLDELFGGMSVPVVCANLKLTATGASPPWMMPSLKLERAGLRFGLIGLTAAFRDFYGLLGWQAEEPLTALRAEARKIRPEVDVLIVLSHLGLPIDRQIAQTVEGIDLILGGHTHHLLEQPLREGRTVLSAAGKFGSHYGLLELRFGADGRLRTLEGGCYPSDGCPPPPDLAGLVAAYRDRAKAEMSRTVATLPAPLEAPSDRESRLGNLLARAVREAVSAEIGLVNAGQFLDRLPAGEVTEEAIHALCPSPINACSLRLRGEQIIFALEESLLPEFQQLEIRGFGFRGKVLGTLCMDGMEAVADLSRPPYSRVSAVRVGGEPLDPQREYTVGSLDMFTFGIGYLSLKDSAETRYLLPDFIRHLLAAALQRDAWLRDSAAARWHYI